MRHSALVVPASVLLLVNGCIGTPDALAPAAPSHAAASAAQKVDASGHFDAIVDFSTLTLEPKGQNCRLEVDGQLILTGTITGSGTGHTSALVSATCAQVASAPPGTYPDVFKSAITLDGTVDGQPVHATGWYMGHSQEGGAIDARFVLTGDLSGQLDVTAQLAVGGEYSGSIVLH